MMYFRLQLYSSLLQIYFGEACSFRRGSSSTRTDRVASLVPADPSSMRSWRSIYFV